MQSFKLEKSETSKKSISQGGAFLLIIGIVVAVLFQAAVGGVLALVGLIMLIAGAFASDTK